MKNFISVFLKNPIASAILFMMIPLAVYSIDYLFGAGLKTNFRDSSVIITIILYGVLGYILGRAPIP